MAIAPTKGNLINLKKSLALAENGYELLDRKRNILVREMMRLIEDAEEIQRDIDESYEKAYKALQAANVSLGISAVRTAASVEEENSLTLSYRSVMGVEIPRVNISCDVPLVPAYGMHNTDLSLDEAYINFNKVKALTARLAEIENSVYRLANAVKKTRKRANSLKNVVIPNFRADIKLITEVLEEKEREEFSRLKVIKARK